MEIQLVNDIEVTYSVTLKAGTYHDVSFQYDGETYIAVEMHLSASLGVGDFIEAEADPT